MAAKRITKYKAITMNLISFFVIGCIAKMDSFLSANLSNG